jgi:hypothetical protein
MADPVDFTDPCATAAWLRSIYYSRVAGMAVTELRFGERAVKYAQMDDAGMLAEIQRLDERCALKGGPTADPTVPPQRHAIGLGSRQLWPLRRVGPLREI